MNERWAKLERLLRSLDRHTIDQAVATLEALGDVALFDHLLKDVHVMRPKENVPPMPTRAREALALALTVPTLHPGPHFDGPQPDMPARLHALLGVLAASPSESAEAARLRRTRRLWLHGHRGELDVRRLVQAFPQLEQLVIATCTRLHDLPALGQLPCLRELAFVELREVDTEGLELPESCWTVGFASCGAVRVDGVVNVSRLAFHTQIITQRLQALTGVREVVLTQTARTRIVHLHALSTLTQIESIEVDEIDEYETLVPNEPWRRKKVPIGIFAACRRLRSLRLTNARVEARELAQLLGHPALERLQIDAAYYRELPHELRRSLPFVVAIAGAR